MKQNIIGVYTGNGKGKTTASLGMIFRACGHGQRCGVLQFIKSGPEAWGEYKMAKRLGIDWENYGCGFTWKEKDHTKSIEEVRKGWEQAKAWMLSGEYDLILLDEISYVLTYDWVDAQEVAQWLTEHREELPTLLLTGRAMAQPILDVADLISEITDVKHHLRSRGVPAQEGIEF